MISHSAKIPDEGTVSLHIRPVHISSIAPRIVIATESHLLLHESSGYSMARIENSGGLGPFRKLPNRHIRIMSASSVCFLERGRHDVGWNFVIVRAVEANRGIEERKNYRFGHPALYFRNMVLGEDGQATLISTRWRNGVEWAHVWKMKLQPDNESAILQFIKTYQTSRKRRILQAFNGGVLYGERQRSTIVFSIDRDDAVRAPCHTLVGNIPLPEEEFVRTRAKDYKELTIAGNRFFFGHKEIVFMGYLPFADAPLEDVAIASVWRTLSESEQTKLLRSHQCSNRQILFAAIKQEDSKTITATDNAKSSPEGSEHEKNAAKRLRKRKNGPNVPDVPSANAVGRKRTTEPGKYDLRSAKQSKCKL